LDKGIRREILENQRKVQKGEKSPGVWVYAPAYPRVLDKLNDLLVHHDFGGEKKKT